METLSKQKPYRLKDWLRSWFPKKGEPIKESEIRKPSLAQGVSLQRTSERAGATNTRDQQPG